MEKNLLVIAALLSVSAQAATHEYRVPIRNLEVQESRAVAITAEYAGQFQKTLVGSTSNRVVTLTNTGESELVLASPPLAISEGGPFSQVTTTCGLSLAKGASCATKFRFSPTTAGDYSSAVSVASDAKVVQGVISLQGTAYFDGLLMHMDGNYLDEVGSRTPYLFNGTALTFSTAEKAFGTHSLSFNGSTYLCLAPFNFVEPITNNFTVEFWLKPTTTTEQAIFTRHVYGAALGFYLLRTSAGALALYETPWAVLRGITPDGATPANQWAHIALVRNNGVTRIYVNGQSRMSTTTSDVAYYNGTGSYGNIAIGGGACNVGHSPFTGFIDEFRIAKGANYTADFPVPTRAPD